MVGPYQVITKQMCKEIIGFVHGIENVLDCTTVYSALLYIMLTALVELKSQGKPILWVFTSCCVKVLWSTVKDFIVKSMSKLLTEFYRMYSKISGQVLDLPGFFAIVSKLPFNKILLYDSLI